MEDPNSIARLCPAMSEDQDKNGRSWEAIRMNISECIPPQGETKSDLRSRESTVSLEDEEDDTQNDTSYPGLQLTFNPGSKGRRGLELGTHPNCDIVLPELSKISRLHCALTFDDQRRLILRDFSRHGTIVKYNGKGGELRRTIITYDEGREVHHHFTWILGGHRVPRRTERIVIEIQGISFRIIVSTHDENPRLYNANVDRFLQEAKANEELPLGGLGIQSPNSTAPPSGARTPNQGPIRLKQEALGEGAFAVVRRYWDVSTGLEYAYKEPRDKKKFGREMWEKEADIMQQISHKHVVKFVDWMPTPWPRLILEYVPFGSLEDQKTISDEDCVTILCQGLSALVDLHGREEPIVHRDIKPGNILIHSPDPLHIKLTDFGLSRVSKDLTTFCGTALYLAPEVYRKESYTPAVDIWSLGVVVFKFAYGLPNHHKYAGRSWCERIVKEANNWESEDLINFLSTAMLAMDPEFRYSAQDCYREASRLPVPSEGRCLTPTPISYAEGHERPALYYPGQEIRDRSIPISPNVNSSQHEYSTNSIPSSVIRRYVRSDAPSPGAETRKRSTRQSTSSSPSGGRRTKRHGKGTAASSSSRSQREESEPVIDLFGEGWLQDPNCVGSSVAAMGEDPSDWSSWGTRATGPLERYVPRSIPEPVDEYDNDHDPHLIQGGAAFPQNAYFVNTVAQDGGNGACTDSEGYMAARMLQAIREGERP